MLREANLHWRYLDKGFEFILPWYTLPCLKWLLEQDYKSWKVFEYGGGYSTVWYKLFCQSVDGVDAIYEWAKLGGIYYTKDKEEYINRISIYNSFDVVVVDGIYRMECIKKSADSVRNGGYMILDNYEDYTEEEIDSIKKILFGWEFNIYKQPNHSRWTTTVLRKP